MTDTIFGSLIGNPNVEDAIVETLRTWLPTCLDVIERRNALPLRSVPRPPSHHSIRAAASFEFDAGAWQEDECPCVIAVVNPTGQTERNAAGYGSWFEVEIGVLIVSQETHEARRWAGWYGLAVAMAIGQHGGLGGIATGTVMVNAPFTETPEPDRRALTRARVVFQTFIDGLIDPTAGPKVATPPVSPEYPGTPDAPWNDPPVVTSTPVTLVAEPVD